MDIEALESMEKLYNKRNAEELLNQKIKLETNHAAEILALQGRFDAERTKFENRIVELEKQLASVKLDTSSNQSSSNNPFEANALKEIERQLVETTKRLGETEAALATMDGKRKTAWKTCDKFKMQNAELQQRLAEANKRIAEMANKINIESSLYDEGLVRKSHELETTKKELARVKADLAKSTEYGKNISNKLASCEQLVKARESDIAVLTKKVQQLTESRDSTLLKYNQIRDAYNGSVADCNKANKERDAAIQDRDKAIQERDKANQERDKAIQDRNKSIDNKNMILHSVSSASGLPIVSVDVVTSYKSKYNIDPSKIILYSFTTSTMTFINPNSLTQFREYAKSVDGNVYLTKVQYSMFGKTFTYNNIDTSTLETIPQNVRNFVNNEITIARDFILKRSAVIHDSVIIYI
jgi:uncharacterized protein (DUF3084 family)